MTYIDYSEKNYSDKDILLALVDDIVENIQEQLLEDSADFLEQSRALISTAQDLTSVIPNLLLWMLADSKYGISQHPKLYTKGIKSVIALLQRTVEGADISQQQWIEASQQCDQDFNHAAEDQTALWLQAILCGSLAAMAMLPIEMQLAECQEGCEHIWNAALIMTTQIECFSGPKKEIVKRQAAKMIELLEQNQAV